MQGIQVAQEEALKQVTSENVNKVAKQAMGMVAREVSSKLPSLQRSQPGLAYTVQEGPV